MLMCLWLTSGLRASIWLYVLLAVPISSMVSGRLDKASIDSDTKLSIVCMWPKNKEEIDLHKETKTEKESESKGDVMGL